MHQEVPTDCAIAPGRRVAFRWFWGCLHVIVFVICVFALKRIHISDEDFGSGGLTTITYSACRAILSLYLLGVCFTLGALLLRIWNDDPRQQGISDLPFGIVCFFLGASMLGLVGTAIGLAGFLKLPVVLMLITPLIFLAPSYVVPYASSLLKKARAAAAQQDVLGQTLHGFLAWYLLIVIALLLLWKGLYPASAEADVWEHYLPYYREVLRTGSVAPNEVWVHYWASKAAGLTHIVGVLSDEFSAQLVSWALIVMTTVIVVDLLRSALSNTAWALFGAIVFLLGVMADPSIGAFTRHHAPITAFIGFLVWATVQILSPKSSHRKTIFVSALIVAFYAGLYLAQVVPLFAAFFGTLAAAAVVIRRFRFAVQPLAGLLFATIAGMLTEFLVSYVFTGVASMVSVRWFWPISDQEKFGAIVGNSGILYLIFANHDNPPWGEPWAWLNRLFRLQHFLPLFAGALAIALATALIRFRQVNRVSGFQKRDVIPAVVAGAFLLVSVIPPLVFRNESTMRLYLFLNLLVPIIVLTILKGVTDTCRETLLKRLWIAGFLIVLSLTFGWIGLRQYPEHIKASVAYAGGKLSTAEALKRTADAYGEPERFDFVQAVRRRIGLDPKIFTFTYAPGPGSAFPGRGMMSEPMYSLGPQYLELIFGTPDRAAQLLQKQGINYFHFSLEDRLFTGLAFSNLFRADSLDHHFKLAYREGRQFLLTWRGPGDVEPLPPELTETLELKQKAVLVYPFGSEFFKELQAVVRTALVETGHCGPESASAVGDSGCLIGPDLTESVDQILRKRMAFEELLPQNRHSVQAILENIKRELTGRLPKQITELRRKVLSEHRPPQVFAEALTLRLTAEVVTMVQIEVMNACIMRFARPSCEPLTHRDEQIPFGVIYRSKLSVSNILQFDLTDVGAH
ncbi:MAG: hypothetical protein JW384_00415 [Nitrosomonadaceae bacterium]|nr:hypothetical protein [Nitrosomonadaceae bacterium]